MSPPASRRTFIERIMGLVGLGVAGASLGPAFANAQSPQRFYGKYRGSVTNNNDPLKLGRILASVPAVPGDLLGWAMPSVPYAGAGVGFFMLPPEGGSVWIEFEGGDPNYPIWSGGFWSEQELPSLGSPAIPAQKIIKTSAGHTILIDDTANGEHIQMVAAGGAAITLDKSGISLEMGPTKMLISATGVTVNGKALRMASSTAAISEILLFAE